MSILEEFRAALINTECNPRKYPVWWDAIACSARTTAYKQLMQRHSRETFQAHIRAIAAILTHCECEMRAYQCVKAQERKL